jgi:hypothetical protein
MVNNSSGDRVTSGACINFLIDADDSAWVVNRGYIVICWPLIFSWFGGGSSKVTLMGGW